MSKGRNLSKHTRKYKKEQDRARKSIEPRMTKDYKFNPLPNRKTRRLQATAKNRSAWKEANAAWSNMNMQTVRKAPKGMVIEYVDKKK